MIDSNRELEWQFGTEDGPAADSWISSTAEEQSAITESAHQPDQHRLHKLYEWILIVAVLYSVALTMLWHHLHQNMIRLETELSSVHDELSNISQLETAETSSATVSPSYSYETEHLRFVASRETKEIVAAILEESDAHYSQLHEQLRSPLPPDSTKPTIFVDQMINSDYQLNNGLKIYIGHPKFKANRYGLSETDVLAGEVSNRLSQHLFDTDIHRRDIPLHWQALTMALGTHLSLDGGNKPMWKFESTYLAYRHRAQNHPLQLVQEVYHGVNDHLDPWPLYTPKAVEAANPLAEFIIDTYGYRTIPSLLDAFEEHETWETLSPVVFGISAATLEEDWHTYLRQKYPRPKDWDG